ncbi:hypothetical protein [Leyella stercorea]|uniref:hypothetical protein n=1 Tax=Leyella stercorea TaxID=363265 RepID=UPI003AB89E7D
MSKANNHRLRASASTVTSICIDRYEHLRRPLRASASTVTYDAQGHLGTLFLFFCLLLSGYS